MSHRSVYIRAAGVLGPVGASLKEAWRAFDSTGHHLCRRVFNGEEEWVAPLSATGEQEIGKIRQERALFDRLDRSVLMAIAAARQAFEGSLWELTNEIGVTIGSSRGATATFEEQYRNFMTHPHRRSEVTTSPTTTLGNLSTMVAQDLMLRGPDISSSVTCSTALQSVLTAISWLRSGLGDYFLAGGAEAPLTDFTIAQMRALRIYTHREESPFPCRPLGGGESPVNSFVLGEGAAVFALDTNDGEGGGPALAEITGIGWGSEKLSSLTSMTDHGESFGQAMQRALDSQIRPGKIDLVITHAPGTIMGDRAEVEAVKRVFGSDSPPVVSPKWKIGHTFGASGAFGMLYGIHLLRGGRLVAPGYLGHQFRAPEKTSRVIVNAAGFGGNASSIILTVPA